MLQPSVDGALSPRRLPAPRRAVLPPTSNIMKKDVGPRVRAPRAWGWWGGGRGTLARARGNE